MKDHSMPTVSLVKLTQALVFVLLLVVAQYGTTVSAQSASISNANAFEQEPVQEHRKMGKLTRPERCATCDSKGVQEGITAAILKIAEDSLADTIKEKKDIKTAYDKQEKVRDDAKELFDAAWKAFDNARTAYREYLRNISGTGEDLKKELNNLTRALEKKKKKDAATLKNMTDKCTEKCAKNQESKNCKVCLGHLELRKIIFKNEQKEKESEIGDKKKVIDKIAELRKDMQGKSYKNNPDTNKKRVDYNKAVMDLYKLEHDCKEKEKEVADRTAGVALAKKIHDFWVWLFDRCQGRKCK